jgi:NAD(P)-dependent dehydrogenase (short-subunit alcohol dehydrogenase family)
VLVIESDAASVAAQKALAKQVGEAFGGLDVLVPNAGVVEMRPMGMWDEAAFDRSMGINFKGPFFLIQELLPYFANPASIVLMASVNAHVGMPNTSVYGASKAALASLARTLSGELVGRGIRVNAVSPGRLRLRCMESWGCRRSSLRVWRSRSKDRFR